MNHFKIPKLNPFQFIKEPQVGTGFDEAWARNQIKSWDFPIFYQQKWQKSETTKLQIECSVTPNDLLVINRWGQTVKSFNWSIVLDAIGYKIWECTFDISDQSEDVYFLYQLTEFGSLSWPAITEPINCKANWPDTLMFDYTNSFNDFDVAFTATNITFKFRVEGHIPPHEIILKRDSSEYVNQNNRITLLKGYPNEAFNLYVGGTNRDDGVAPWVMRLMNRIFDCDKVLINNKQFAALPGSEWKTTAIKGYPLITGSLEIAETDSNSSLEFADTTPIASNGIVVAYDFDTDFFGVKATVPIDDVEENK